MSFKESLQNDILKTHLNVNEFGETVEYQPVSDPFFDLQIIWDDAYQAMDTETGNIVNSKQPKITCRTKDLIDNLTAKEPDQNDIIVKDSINYRVHQHIPDGGGISEIILNKVG